jgi:hypothetical protein
MSFILIRIVTNITTQPGRSVDFLVKKLHQLHPMQKLCAILFREVWALNRTAAARTPGSRGNQRMGAIEL